MNRASLFIFWWLLFKHYSQSKTNFKLYFIPQLFLYAMLNRLKRDKLGIHIRYAVLEHYTFIKCRFAIHLRLVPKVFIEY